MRQVEEVNYEVSCTGGSLPLVFKKNLKLKNCVAIEQLSGICALH